MAASSSSVLQAHAELWNLTFSYLKSVALESAVSLGVLNAIHSLGGAATLQDLLATVPLPEHRKTHFPRLMRFLAATGIVTLDVPAPGEGGDEAAAAGVYRLTPVSRLLVDDDVGGNMCASLSPFVLMQVNKYHVMPSLHLSAWFKGDDDDGQLMPAETPFKMAYGSRHGHMVGRDLQFNEIFNAGLASDSQFVLDSVITTCGDDVFGGITSLVDVGGGTGTAARAIAKAFPHVACSVLDLPTVISGIRPPSGDTVEYIAGDMRNSIPPADAVLRKVCLLPLKVVLRTKTSLV